MRGAAAGEHQSCTWCSGTGHEPAPSRRQSEPSRWWQAARRNFPVPNSGTSSRRCRRMRARNFVLGRAQDRARRVMYNPVQEARLLGNSQRVRDHSHELAAETFWIRAATGNGTMPWSLMALGRIVADAPRPARMVRSGHRRVARHPVIPANQSRSPRGTRKTGSVGANLQTREDPRAWAAARLREGSGCSHSTPGVLAMAAAPRVRTRTARPDQNAHVLLCGGMGAILTQAAHLGYGKPENMEQEIPAATAARGQS